MSIKSRFLFSMAVVVIAIIIAMVVRVDKPDADAPAASAQQTSGENRPVNRDKVFQKQFRIEPGRRVGNITAKSTLADIRQTYGAENVKESEVYVGEGQSMPGVVVYGNDPEKKLEVVWKEDAQTPATVFIRAPQDGPAESVWHTEQGITLGTTLKELESLNEGSFTLAGFGWDYSGTVLGWNDGQLKEPLYGKVLLRLNPDYEDAPQTLIEQTSGDSDFASSHPAMQRLNPTVDTLIVVFE